MDRACYQQQERGTPTLLVFGAAALFVFLVLVAQYESWKLPLAIVLVVPMCLLASVTGLLARGLPIDILAQIGFVVLVGLAAKNAILRPILMTSFAFILEVAPLAVATGAGAEMRQSLGTAVLSGMIGVTCFGLLFTPAFYTFIRKLGREDRRRRMTAIGVRREKAALSSGCKSHPATAPAGSNRSSHGGDEMAEAFGVAGHVLVSAPSDRNGNRGRSLRIQEHEGECRASTPVQSGASLIPLV
jgi:AcrB/AcrD/AcrF family protein